MKRFLKAFGLTFAVGMTIFFYALMVIMFIYGRGITLHVGYEGWLEIPLIGALIVASVIALEGWYKSNY